jgi:hypothetical protein
LLQDNFEAVCEKIHDAWWKEKRQQGFHAPNECPSKNHKSFQESNWREKERLEDIQNPKFYKWCDKCHTDMYSYSDLPNNIQEYDRTTVKAVSLAIELL